MGQVGILLYEFHVMSVLSKIRLRDPSAVPVQVLPNHQCQQFWHLHKSLQKTSWFVTHFTG